MNKFLLVLFGFAACFGIGSVAWKTLGGGDVTSAFAESIDPNVPHPCVGYVGSPDHDFGTMDVNAQGSFTFRISNSGNAPLKLDEGPSSCQCTLADLVDNAIPPGEIGEVELTWTTQEDSGKFAQGVTIWTNDPEEPAIVLRVTGDVQKSIGIAPHELVFPNSTPGEAPTGEFSVYSFMNESMRIARTSDEKSQWIQSIELVSEQELAEQKALAGYRIKVELPADQEAGYFVHEIPIAVISETADGEERRIERLPIRGTVQSSFAVFGRKVRSDGILKLGFLPYRQGAHEELTVVLREADESVEVQSVECPLPWISFSTTRRPSERTEDQVFRVEITIPENAPVGAHYGDGGCLIEIKTNHPRAPVIRLLAEFAVLSPGVRAKLHN
ncbi:MAG: DUF1573 domain-containing protein [Pirellulales bacterium]|nr:DUF1573 domain-containing protein [Pirellulales bacterium]